VFVVLSRGAFLTVFYILERLQVILGQSPTFEVEFVAAERWRRRGSVYAEVDDTVHVLFHKNEELIDAINLGISRLALDPKVKTSTSGFTFELKASFKELLHYLLLKLVLNMLHVT
jgi:hypothetical protein